jgi:3-isopropylmalate/(R)-2-methylmalate dehydratase small subunit
VSAWLLENAGVEVRLDIAARTLTLPDGSDVPFPLEAFAQHCLLEGVDELGFLLARRGEIEAFERRQR